MSANAAIYYDDDAFRIDVPKLMGRQMAGSGFLNGFLRHAAAETLYVYGTTERAASAFTKIAASHGQRPVKWVAPATIERLAAPGCLFLPGPNLEDHAWRRLRHGDRSWSLCGVTHTTASHRVMDSFANMLIAPLAAWDAVICTSRAVRDTARVVLESQADYLRWRLGPGVHAAGPQLPLIPLGVDLDRFEIDGVRRQRVRQAFGIGTDDIVVLFVGRISFHAKAHPQQMYLALERAARGRKTHLIQAGWAANNHIDRAFREGAKALCPSVNAIFIDAREQERATDCWAAADVFCSLSDNIQETFGLTPVEAMACGLPVVVTDWDGYRDTVRDGVDGFLIPTLTPAQPLGDPLAQRHESGLDSYDMYCGNSSQFTAVDPDACTQAFERLFASPALRRSMGAAGRERVREVYDWRVIVQRYQSLWAELAERRRADPAFGVRAAPACRPGREDPFALFASYPTTQLGGDHLVSRMPGASMAVLDARRALKMNSYAAAVQPSPALCATLIDLLPASGSLAIDVILGRITPPDRHAALLGLTWLAKMEIVKIAQP